MLLSLGAGHAGAEPVIILFEGGVRREVAPEIRNGLDYVALDHVIQGLGVRAVSDPAGGAATFSRDGREISLYAGKSLAAVGGDLRLLAAPVILDGTRWLLPLEAAPKLLEPLLGWPVAWHPAQRVLVVGHVPVPKVSVTTYVTADTVRLVLEASERVPFQAQQEASRVTVAIPRDLIEVSFGQERLTGGIVDRVEFLGGKQNLFAAELGRRFGQVKAYEQDGPPRFVLEFQAATSTAPKTAGAPTPTSTPRPALDLGGLRTVVIDPGHGGEEVGAQGPGGTVEKDVTLQIARRLRASLQNNLGLQVFLTRDADVAVDLDERAAIANNYKADLFISIHANAARSHGAAGSEVYFLSYQATDDESRRVALQEGASLPDAAVPQGSDLAMILWDMAQAEHLEGSSALASRILDELAGVTGSEGRGVKQAPFRVLVGAAMPAVLVEVAFISNPEEEKRLNSGGFQSQVATAIVRGVARFEREWTRRAGLGGVASRPGLE